MPNDKTFDLHFSANVKAQNPTDIIENLSQTYGNDVFQKMLNTLLENPFSPREAKAHWITAIQNFTQDCARINWRAIMFDHLLTQTDLLKNPRIVDANILQQLQINAVTDGLTNLYNQSHFKTRLAEIIKEHEKHPDTTFSLIIFDLDHFKQFNDRSGHLRGDHALAKVGKLICALLPENGLAARYGGEEFAVILPEADLPKGIAFAETIRSTVEQTAFDGEDRLDLGNLTISGGVACYPAAGKSTVAMIAHADSKLYDAKVTRNSISPRLGESRGLTRHNFRSIVEIMNEKTGKFQNSLSADNSYTGILLKTPSAAPVGSNLNLRFPYPFWPTDHDTSGEVRHVRNNDNRGDFLIGIQFLQPQTEFIEKILPSEIYAPNH
jgi:diguanylate cyclase (GGDEF)-like protein